MTLRYTVGFDVGKEAASSICLGTNYAQCVPALPVILFHSLTGARYCRYQLGVPSDQYVPIMQEISERAALLEGVVEFLKSPECGGCESSLQDLIDHLSALEPATGLTD